MHFSELKPLSEKRKAALLPELVREHGMFMMGDPDTPARPTRIVIGVAPWDLRELDWLDAVVEAFARMPLVTIEVFSTDGCQSTNDVCERIPGWDLPLHQPPFVGIWRDGILQEVAQGAKARNLVLDAIAARDKN